MKMARAASTRGLQDIAMLRSRCARDYGVGRLSWDDLEYIDQRLTEIQERLIAVASGDPAHLAAEQEADARNSA
jgi:hypothetical protein